MKNKEKQLEKKAKEPYVVPNASVENIDGSDIVNASVKGETPFVPAGKLLGKWAF